MKVRFYISVFVLVVVFPCRAGGIDDILWPMVVPVKVGMSDRAVQTLGRPTLEALVRLIHQAAQLVKEASPTAESHLYRWAKPDRLLKDKSFQILLVVQGDPAASRLLGAAANGVDERLRNSPFIPMVTSGMGGGLHVVLVTYADRLLNLLYNERTGELKRDGMAHLFVHLGARTFVDTTRVLEHDLSTGPPKSFPASPDWEKTVIYLLVRRIQSSTWFSGQPVGAKLFLRALLRHEEVERAGKERELPFRGMAVKDVSSWTIEWNPTLRRKADEYSMTAARELFRTAERQLREMPLDDNHIFDWKLAQAPANRDLAVMVTTRGSREMLDLRAHLNPIFIDILEASHPFGFTCFGFYSYPAGRPRQYRLGLIFFLEDLVVDDQGEMRPDAPARILTALANTFYGITQHALNADLSTIELVPLRTQLMIAGMNTQRRFLERFVQTSAYTDLSQEGQAYILHSLMTAERTAKMYAEMSEKQCEASLGGPELPPSNPGLN